MKILITGDSFGCGEWQIDPDLQSKILLHKGIEHYLLEENYDVLNVSIAGSPNKFAIKRLSLVLDFNPDIILWFQSDPLRDLFPFNDFTEKFNTFEELIELNNNILDNHYSTLNSLDKKIYCIGGCSKINSNLIVKYNNLIPLINSVPEFLFPEYKHPELWHSGWQAEVHKIQDLKLLTKLLACKVKQCKLITEQRYKDLFWPDGMHPNRIGYYKIYEFIKSKIL